MKIIFLGGLFPDETRKEIEKKSSGVIQYAADALQWALVEGIGYKTQDFTLVNLPYVGSYPKRYRDYRIKSFDFSHRRGANDINVGFVNVPLYKFYSRYLNARNALRDVLNNDEEVVLIYAMHLPFIKAAVELKAENPTIKICLIVPDLPEFMSDKTGLLFKVLRDKEKKMLDILLKEIDAYVLLSDNMHKALNIKDKPWISAFKNFQDYPFTRSTLFLYMAGIILLFFVEPVMDGMYLLFLLFCMFSGLIAGIKAPKIKFN